MITEISEWSRLENNIDRNFSQRFDERVPGSYLFNPETGKVYNVKGHAVDKSKHCIGRVGPEGEFYKVKIEEENGNFYYMYVSQATGNWLTEAGFNDFIRSI